MRNSIISLKLQPWSVNPDAIAGTEVCHCMAELVPLVGRGWDKGWGKPARGMQKLS